MSPGLSQNEVERIAKTAAHEAVKETLQTLGFDISEPFEVQQDQSFLRTMRVGTRRSIFTALTSFITAIVTLIAGAVWLLLNKPH